MDNIQNTIKELSTVLKMLPGVNVVTTAIDEINISIELSIMQIESIGPILYAANGANLPFNIYSKAPREPVNERANPVNICYEISAKNNISINGTALDALKLFGTFIVWYLHGIGKMPKTESNRLLSMWDGAQVNT